MAATSHFDTWVQRTRLAAGPAGTPRLRLFCLPYAGGGASIYRLWPDELPDDLEVCAIQLPGRESRLREPTFTAVAPLVRELARALLPELSLPFALVGHSMGALIAFELVRLLRREHGLSPVYLFVSARRAPQLPSLDAPIHLLPQPAFVDHLLRRYNGIPQAVLREPELMEIFLPTLRADFTVIETYRYAADEPLGCPITAFGGLQDDLVTRSELAGWQEQTRAAFDLHMFPGTHFFLHQQRPSMLRIVAGHLTG